MTKIKDVLNENTKSDLYKKSKRRKRNKSKVKKDPLKEKLSMSELKHLMGMDRDRYARGRGGAVRRK